MSVSSIFSPYHPNYYRNRKVGSSPMINVKDTLFGFLKEVKESKQLLPTAVVLEDCRIKTNQEAVWVLNTLNTAQSRYSSLRNIYSQGQYWQRWALKPSNLGKGYVFYFICDGCERHARHLYCPDGQNRYLCRVCHGVSY